MSQQELQITQSWINLNPTGSMQHGHIHANSVISGVFFLQKDATAPPLEFEQPPPGFHWLPPSGMSST